MSAPETNVDTQKKRHKFPLIGIALAVAVGALMIFGMTNLAFDDDSVETTPVVTEGDLPAAAE